MPSKISQSLALEFINYAYTFPNILFLLILSIQAKKFPKIHTPSQKKVFFRHFQAFFFSIKFNHYCVIPFFWGRASKKVNTYIGTQVECNEWGRRRIASFQDAFSAYLYFLLFSLFTCVHSWACMHFSHSNIVFVSHVASLRSSLIDLWDAVLDLREGVVRNARENFRGSG